MSPRRYSVDANENHSLPASPHDNAETLDATVAGLADLDTGQLGLQWRNHLGGTAPAHLPRWLLTTRELESETVSEQTTH
jgi:hypothetical protein